MPISPAQVITATGTTADTRSRMVGRSVRKVDVIGTVNGVTDFITLPSLRTVPNGAVITILCNAGSDFEMRTPAGSAEEINSIDCGDGAQEYLMTDTELVTVRKVNNTIGWEAHGYSQIGAAVTAVVPD